MTTILSALSTIAVGLTSGLYWGFSIAVMPGLRDTDDRAFVDGHERNGEPAGGAERIDELGFGGARKRRDEELADRRDVGGVLFPYEHAKSLR